MDGFEPGEVLSQNPTPIGREHDGRVRALANDVPVFAVQPGAQGRRPVGVAGALVGVAFKGKGRGGLKNATGFAEHGRVFQNKRPSCRHHLGPRLVIAAPVAEAARRKLEEKSGRTVVEFFVAHEHDPHHVPIAEFIFGKTGIPVNAGYAAVHPRLDDEAGVERAHDRGEFLHQSGQGREDQVFIFPLVGMKPVKAVLEAVFGHKVECGLGKRHGVSCCDERRI